MKKFTDSLTEVENFLRRLQKVITFVSETAVPALLSPFLGKPNARFTSIVTIIPFIYHQQWPFGLNVRYVTTVCRKTAW